MNVDEIPDDDSMMRFNSKDRYFITLFSKKKLRFQKFGFFFTSVFKVLNFWGFED